jgi:N-acetylmuramoyl-L-alanine amidase
MKVCIDPGHGMSNRSSGVYDPGATHVEGPARHEEASIALKYGLTLKDAFRAKGVPVFMTRDDATDPTPVGARAGRAEAAGCEAFISLHLNDFDDDAANGTETLYRDDGDKALAAKVQSEMIAITGLRDRGLKQRTDLAVLRFDGTAILIELGFIANDTDRSTLLDTSIRDRLCSSIATTTIAHMGWNPSPMFDSGTMSTSAEMTAVSDAAAGAFASELKENDWGGGAREAYDLAIPLMRGEVPLTQESFRAVFGSSGVRENFNMASFEATVRSWGLRHFSPAELLFLGSAHYAGGACHGSNSLPASTLWGNMEQTAKMADKIRERFGHPLKVISAYRDASYNTCIGGAGGSHHRRFNALDLSPQGGTLRELYAIALDVRQSNEGFLGGIGYYPGSNFIHIDTRGERADW